MTDENETKPQRISMGVGTGIKFGFGFGLGMFVWGLALGAILMILMGSLMAGGM